MSNSLNDLFDDRGGIASVRDVADFFQISERVVRDWAHENNVPRAGNAFAFRVEDAEALAADLAPDDEEEEGPEDEDDEDEEAEEGDEGE